MLVAYWGEGCAEPWCVLTDLPPQDAEVAWYGLRTWCDQGFKVLKRGAWQWQSSRMSQPTRAERLWLALAVATLWMVSVGGEVKAELGNLGLPALSNLLLPARSGRVRVVRLLRLALI